MAGRTMWLELYSMVIPIHQIENGNTMYSEPQIYPMKVIIMWNPGGGGGGGVSTKWSNSQKHHKETTMFCGCSLDVI